MIPKRQRKVGGKTDLSVRPTKPLRTKPEHPNYTNEIPNRGGPGREQFLFHPKSVVGLLVDSEIDLSIDLSTRNGNARVFMISGYLKIIKTGGYLKIIKQDRYQQRPLINMVDSW